VLAKASSTIVEASRVVVETVSTIAGTSRAIEFSTDAKRRSSKSVVAVSSGVVGRF